MKLFGFIPTRMGSTRLPGKALMKIGNNTLVEEVFRKSNKFNGWSELSVAIINEKKGSIYYDI